MNVVDSSGWIEFFLAGANGPKFKPVIEQRDKLVVPVIALFEVHKVLSRKVPPDVVAQCLDVMRLGRVLEITDRRAITAANIALRHGLAMADAMMYSLAQELGATFWTQDIDYQGLPGVQWFAKA
ncbi:MAG: type II toxin-antitoxin system VapC family toxin [Gammaproteobacteria bacterium]|uniref:type II toxin-antitoxin system VapC family toxin n=1 Tax=Rhodoferax sp. TaxID=50421 RepID=UPI0017DE92C8|nr:type II toxin-antitoxin system VapC family toxin [Rhodoferax sp.]MBU3900249.1 type II toxin-antitoxin system VapC family toxin [Gammaproteobacteria bacterium]MBA3057918.1 type II toxin-antitoxin system VapC family toxin [Rhodoferax sp.]MBU3997965.1 type II toxin-antitoxin system VapC family toxin [Gammaproteobacteria bacterium]MBU4079413.1 type II toxin-antitoxin system VapC family toxin [Gammaproteobacteria bacterium]MBU4115026.1 type II toxin-antitoxin system VapC family toxin [Gammaprote